MVEIGYAGNPILLLLWVRQDRATEKVATLAGKAPLPSLPSTAPSRHPASGLALPPEPLHLSPESPLLPAASPEAEEKAHPREKGQQESRQGWRNGRSSPQAAWRPLTPQRINRTPFAFCGMVLATGDTVRAGTMTCSFHIIPFESSPLQKGSGMYL